MTLPLDPERASADRARRAEQRTTVTTELSERLRCGRSADRIAERLAEIKAQEATSAAEAASQDAVVVERRGGGALRSAVFLVAVIVAAAGLLGLAVTLTRLAGDDFADAERLGRATVTSCVQRGPITNKGFGSWDSCTATIGWDDGTTDRLTVAAVFRSSDIGRQVRVGDLGDYRTGKQIVREGAAHRPWLGWIGYAVALVAVVPTLVGVLTVRELLRFRRR